MCTFFEELRAEGERKGRFEGETKQARETAIRLKERDFSIKDIAEVVGFSIIDNIYITSNLYKISICTSCLSML